METNVLTGDKLVDELPLGRRIAEILADRRISPLEFSRRLGWGKDMMYDCLDGTRYIKPSELQQIAGKLGLTVTRIKQDDTKQRQEELQLMLKSKQPSMRSVQIARELLEISIGWSEKFDALINLGAAYFFLRQYEECHQVWVEALPIAEKIKKKFGENERLYTITTNLITSYTIKQDFSTLAQILSKVEPAFAQSNSRRAGTIAFSHAVIASNMGDHTIAKQKLEESLAHFKDTGDPSLIGKGFHNLAYHKFLIGDYHGAREIFEESIRTLDQFPIPRLVAMVDCVKTMIKLKKFGAALAMISDALGSREIEIDPELRAKFLVLQSIATNETQPAESILFSEERSEKIRFIACKFLLRHASERNNSELVLKYFQEAERLGNENEAWEEL